MISNERLAIAGDVSTALSKALHLPENCLEFSVHVKTGKAVIVKGTFYTTIDELVEIERVFKDKAVLLND